MNRCSYCENYLSKLDRCKFCHFEKDKDYNPFLVDDWDIMDLDNDVEWGHIQILKRLNSNGVECIGADIWFDKNMAYLMGCFADTDKIARVLGLHKESVYGNLDNGLVLLNLYQEKDLRKEQKSCESCKYFIDSVFGDCQLGNLNDENIIYDDDGRMRVNCMEWERKE